MIINTVVTNSYLNIQLASSRTSTERSVAVTLSALTLGLSAVMNGRAAATSAFAQRASLRNPKVSVSL